MHLQLQQYLPFTVLKPFFSYKSVTTIVVLQQYLPFTVLKLQEEFITRFIRISSCNSTYRLRYWNLILASNSCVFLLVATVLTVYGIETVRIWDIFFGYPWASCNSTYRLRYWNYHNSAIGYQDLLIGCNSTYRLRYWNDNNSAQEFWFSWQLQQYLPFTVLKLELKGRIALRTRTEVATVLTVYGIETKK